MANVITLLRNAMKARRITSRQLSSQLGYAGNSFVSNVLTGAKTLPLDRAEDWARAAGMRNHEAEEFELACCQQLGPPVVKRVIARLLARQKSNGDR